MKESPTFRVVYLPRHLLTYSCGCPAIFIQVNSEAGYLALPTWSIYQSLPIILAGLGGSKL